MRYLLTLLAVLLSVTARPQEAAPELPAQLRPFAPLAGQCAAYEDLVRQWKPVFAIGFAQTSASTWAAVAADPQAVPPQDKRPFLATDKENHREVLALDVHEDFGGGGRVLIGPAVSGNYAVEMVAQGVSGFSNSEGEDLKAICDLSLIIGAIEQDAGFQFGANFNSRNFLDRQRHRRGWQTHPCPGRAAATAQDREAPLVSHPPDAQGRRTGRLH